MKKILILTLFLFSFCSIYAQQDLIKVISKQAVVIDSLQKVIKGESENFSKQLKEYQKNLKNKSDTLKILKLDLSKLEKFKAEKNKSESLFKQKNDSIKLLSKQAGDVSKQLFDEKQKCRQNLREENIKGKNEVKSEIISNYKNKKFDDLILSSSKISIQRDLLLIDNNTDIKNVLNDLNIYFEAKAIFEKRYNTEQLKGIQSQLNLIKQQSSLLDKLKENIDNYQTFNNGLIDCLLKIDEIDKKETVGSDKVLINLKYNKILSEISTYIFDYDFNFIDNPYLSDVLLQLIKLKKPNPDADISNLIKKLQ